MYQANRSLVLHEIFTSLERGWTFRTLNSSESSQPQGSSTNNFVTFNGFWLLSKKALTPLFLMDNIKLDGMPTKIKWKIQACFTLYFKFTFNFKVLLWKVIRYMYQLFYFLFYISFYISRYYFLQLFRTLLSEKGFCHKFSVFNRFTQRPPHSPFPPSNPLMAKIS